MAEGSFPDVAAREHEAGESCGVPLASAVRGEEALIVASEDAEAGSEQSPVRHELIEPGALSPSPTFPR